MSHDRHRDVSGSIVHNALVKKKNNPFHQWIKDNNHPGIRIPPNLCHAEAGAVCA
jgi:hypothetical protein